VQTFTTVFTVGTPEKKGLFVNGVKALECQIELIGWVGLAGWLAGWLIIIIDNAFSSRDILGTTTDLK